MGVYAVVCICSGVCEHRDVDAEACYAGICVCMCVYICVYMHVCVCALCVYAGVLVMHGYVYTGVCVCVCVCVCLGMCGSQDNVQELFPFLQGFLRSNLLSDLSSMCSYLPSCLSRPGFLIYSRVLRLGM